MKVGGNFILHEQIPVASLKYQTKRDTRPMQAIHIDDRACNVRRDGSWLVRWRLERPGLIVPGAIRAGNADKA